MVKISNLQIKMPRDLIMKKHELDINLCQLCKRIIHFAAAEMTLKVRSYEKISLKLVNQCNKNCKTTEDPIWTYATQNYELKNRILWCFYPKRRRQAVFNATFMTMLITIELETTYYNDMFKYKQNCQYETEISFNKSPVQNEYIFTHMHFIHIVIISLFVNISYCHYCRIDYAA